MRKRNNVNIITAFCTGCALVAFAFNQSSESAIKISSGKLFIAAAIISLLPVVRALFLRPRCQQKLRDLG